MNQAKREQLTEAIQLGRLHIERMQFAREKVKRHFPLNRENYLLLLPEELSFLDQLIFRFSKLQDSMGGKLFPAVLENLGEEIKGVSFIDRLEKLEELGVIPSAGDWMLLRETRNLVTHEYPFLADEVIQGLNLLNQHYLLIIGIWNQVEHFINNRFNLP